MNKSLLIFKLMLLLVLFSCKSKLKHQKNTDATNVIKDSTIVYRPYEPGPDDLIVSRSLYQEQLYGFWLGQCIANWTGLITEMDKIGNIGEIKTGDFYTRENWGKKDQPSIWGEGLPSELSPTIDFMLIEEDSIWGSDDDTDIEYMYQYLMYKNKTSVLSPGQIREGWLHHIKSEEENYIWVSNQKAMDLMAEGVLPPETSSPELNENYMMIDAQLTTEIFGFLAPARPDIALKMAHLPITTTARFDAAHISEFYVVMYSLASSINPKLSRRENIHWMANEARKQLPEDSYASKMYDFVKSQYDNGLSWEAARDAVYQRYQVESRDGYNLTKEQLYCNGCFASGINFASSLVSLFYGEGDLKETIKIGTLCGWDSDNPTATWGGLLGFIIGKEGIEKAFGQKFSSRFNIHRTRQNFPNNGIDEFDHMAQTGVFVVDRVVQDLMKGGVDLEKNVWYIPTP